MRTRTRICGTGFVGFVPSSSTVDYHGGGSLLSLSRLLQHLTSVGSAIGVRSSVSVMQQGAGAASLLVLQRSDGTKQERTPTHEQHETQRATTLPIACVTRARPSCITPGFLPVPRTSLSGTPSVSEIRRLQLQNNHHTSPQQNNSSDLEKQNTNTNHKINTAKL